MCLCSVTHRTFGDVHTSAVADTHRCWASAHLSLSRSSANADCTRSDSCLRVCTFMLGRNSLKIARKVGASTNLNGTHSVTTICRMSWFNLSVESTYFSMAPGVGLLMLVWDSDELPCWLSPPLLAPSPRCCCSPACCQLFNFTVMG